MFLSKLLTVLLQKNRLVSVVEAFKQSGLTSHCELADLNLDILKCYLTN